MKYTLLLFLACTPLMWLTGRSFADLLTKPDDDATAKQTEVVPIDTAPSVELVTKTKKYVTAGQKVIKPIAGSDLLNNRPVAPAELDAAEQAEYPELHAITVACKQSQNGRELVRTVSQLAPVDQLQPQGADHSAERERWIKSRGDELAKRSAAGLVALRDAVSGEDLIFEILDKRAEVLKKSSEEIKKLREVLAKLKEATDAFEARKDDECLKCLGEEPLKSYNDDPKIVSQLQELRKQSQYRVDLRIIAAYAPQSPHTTDQLVKYDSFLSQYPKAVLAEEDASHSQIKRARERLQIDVYLDQWGDPRALEDVLRRIEATLRLPGLTSDDKKVLTKRVVAWLEKYGIPERYPPVCLLGMSEGVTSRSERVVGVIRLSAAGNEWLFWSTVAAAKNLQKLDGERRFAKDYFAEGPDKPKFTYWSGEYTDLRKQLLEDVGAKDRWNAFVRFCETTDVAMVEYREKWGVLEEKWDKECRDWTFKPQAKVAQQVLDNWDRFYVLFR